MIFNIRGHEVHFPNQPYGVQFSFMEKMLRTLEEQGNALLEAPTGCGKTLSLLCAALAWQTKRKKELAAMAAAKLTRAGCARGSARAVGAKASKVDGTLSSGAFGSPTDNHDDDDDFKPADCGPGGLARNRQAPGEGADSPPASDKTAQGDQDSPMNHGLDDDDNDEIPPTPKIYFATRTHSQIAQVVRELKRTAYRPTMAILAGKQHYCINKKVVRTGRVDEECERLLKEEAFGCSYRSRPGAKAGRVHAEVHDIEELSTTCKKAKTCPYFVARDMALTAELVFCPYSYLLDPVVRAALGLDVSGSVLVFDEAHNMEDVCREGGSMDLDLDALREVEGSFRLAAQLTGRADLYEPLAAAAGRLGALLGRFEESADGMVSCGFEEHESVWQGPRALNLLDQAGLGPLGVGELHRAYELAKAYEEKAVFSMEGDAANEAIPSSVTRPGAGGGAMGTLGRLLTVLRLMYAPAPPPPMPTPAAAPPGGGGGGPGGVGSLLSPGQPTQWNQGPPPYPPLHNGAPGGNSAGSRGGGAGAGPGVSQMLPLTTATQAAATGGGFIPSGGGAGGGSGGGGGGRGGLVPVVPAETRDNSSDYRVVVKRWIAHGAKDRRKARSRLRKGTDDGEAAIPPGAAVSLGLWCLNPAVAFRHLANKAHSVVLTSGTLAPLDSFASELGTEFHVRLEAPHVVDMSRQVWASVVPRGPGGASLSATYKESATFRFQDDSGEAVVRYCQVIPDGVLLFLPSYGLLDKLMTRWKSTGLWSRLEAVKTVVVEGREAGKGFEDAMARYYAAVRSGKGGLFLAVCRGKASEGIDFADQHARGVILLGIPFPAIKDTKVRLKKEYNDASSGPSSGRAPAQRLLSGDAWYSQQAFRALNQAVGRCIRHKYDWGAIILLDERFRGQGRQQQLSRWVRAAVKVHEDFEASTADLSAFCQRLTSDPPRPPPPPPTPPPQPVENADAKGSSAVPNAAQGPMTAASAPAVATLRSKLASAKGGKGIDLQYEEDVVPPADMPVENACGGGCGGGSSGSNHRPFDRFRMPAAPAVATAPGAAMATAPAAPGQRCGGPSAGGRNRSIVAFFSAAPPGGSNVVADTAPASDKGDSCCSGGNGVAGPGRAQQSACGYGGPLPYAAAGSSAAAQGGNAPYGSDPQGMYGARCGMPSTQQPTQQYHSPQPLPPPGAMRGCPEGVSVPLPHQHYQHQQGPVGASGSMPPPGYGGNPGAQASRGAKWQAEGQPPLPRQQQQQCQPLQHQHEQQGHWQPPHEQHQQHQYQYRDPQQGQQQQQPGTQVPYSSQQRHGHAEGRAEGFQCASGGATHGHGAPAQLANHIHGQQQQQPPQNHYQPPTQQQQPWAPFGTPAPCPEQWPLATPQQPPHQSPPPGQPTNSGCWHGPHGNAGTTPGPCQSPAPGVPTAGAFGQPPHCSPSASLASPAGTDTQSWQRQEPQQQRQNNGAQTQQWSVRSHERHAPWQPQGPQQQQPYSGQSQAPTQQQGWQGQQHPPGPRSEVVPGAGWQQHRHTQQPWQPEAGVVGGSSSTNAGSWRPPPQEASVWNARYQKQDGEQLRQQQQRHEQQPQQQQQQQEAQQQQQVWNLQTGSGSRATGTAEHGSGRRSEWEEQHQGHWAGREAGGGNAAAGGDHFRTGVANAASARGQGAASSCTGWQAGQRQEQYRQQHQQPSAGNANLQPRRGAQHPVKRLTSSRAREAAEKRMRMQQPDVGAGGEAAECGDARATGAWADPADMDDNDDFV